MDGTKSLSFSNPRLKAEFDNWPSGSKQVKCKFEIEYNEKKDKYRVVRTTESLNGRGWNKPKNHTYGHEAVIVDGSNGKTYILQLHRDYEFINIIRFDLLHEGSVNKVEEPEKYEKLRTLILDNFRI